jgi:hypothetical protein
MNWLTCWHGVSINRAVSILRNELIRRRIWRSRSISKRGVNVAHDVPASIHLPEPDSRRRGWRHRFHFFFFACGGPLFPAFPIWDFAWGFPAPKRVTTCGVNRPRVHTLRTVNHRY